MEKHNIWILNIFLFKQYMSKRNFKITVNYMYFTRLPRWHSGKKNPPTNAGDQERKVQS